MLQIGAKKLKDFLEETTELYQELDEFNLHKIAQFNKNEANDLWDSHLHKKYIHSEGKLTKLDFFRIQLTFSLLLKWVPFCRS